MGNLPIIKWQEKENIAVKRKESVFKITLLGFFFAGVLPGGIKNSDAISGITGGDALILQYLNNVPVDYDTIQLESDIARKILAHIREHDPNRI